MLIGLSFKDTDSNDYKEEVGVTLANAIGGRTRVFESRNLTEYFDTLKFYKPSGRENLVLINTHYDRENHPDFTLGYWRAVDMDFANKGGVIFGQKPEKSAATYQQRILTDNFEHMVLTGEYYQERAKRITKEVKGYFGRTDSDPHTVLVGFRPSVPNLSSPAHSLFTGLPDEKDWWQGVAFAQRKTTKPENFFNGLQIFTYASFIAVTDTADRELTQWGIEHQVAEPIKNRSLSETIKYGKKLRQLSRLDAERVVA